MARKFIYYLKGFSRTIVITDTDENKPMEEIVSKISKAMAGVKVSKFETDNDILIVRPSDIVGVHIAKDSSKHEDVVYTDEPPAENIRLQSIVPEIDLGDIETNDELEVEEIIEEKISEDDSSEEDINKKIEEGDEEGAKDDNDAKSD